MSIYHFSLCHNFQYFIIILFYNQKKSLLKKSFSIVRTFLEIVCLLTDAELFMCIVQSIHDGSVVGFVCHQKYLRFNNTQNVRIIHLVLEMLFKVSHFQENNFAYYIFIRNKFPFFLRISFLLFDQLYLNTFHFAVFFFTFEFAFPHPSCCFVQYVCIYLFEM